MWVINIQHWLDGTKTGPAVPQLKTKVQQFADIITYATSMAIGLESARIPKCRRRPKRKPFKGIPDIHNNDSEGWQSEL